MPDKKRETSRPVVIESLIDCLLLTKIILLNKSTDSIFVLILVQIQNDIFEVINKYGNP